MKRPPVSDDPIAVIDAESRKRGVGYLFLAVILAILTVAVGYAVNYASDARDDITAVSSQQEKRDVRINNLEKNLEAQRAQFQVCKNKKPGAAGCIVPVAPEVKNIGPQGIQGFQGVPGPQGIQGVRGRQGPAGKDGKDGADGLDGTNGTDGENGAAGPVGPAGPEGAAGKDGKDGNAGPPGEEGPAADNFSFTYLGITYICTDPERDTQYNCAQETV